MKPKVIAITGATLVFAVIISLFKTQLQQFANPVVVQVLIIVVGLLAAAVTQWMMTQRNKADDGGGGGGGGEPVASADDLDQLIQEAEKRLASAQLQKNAKLGTLPAIFIVGEPGTAKTTTMVNSGLDPELVAGQVYEETNLVPTPIINLWFTRHTIFVEAAGKMLGDAGSWTRLVKRLQPAKLSRVFGKGGQVPRAAVVCVEAEKLLGNADALTVAARTLRARLGEIAQTLGINLPIYVLFTKSDRIQFFAEYVRNLNNEEASQALGITLPMVTARQGLYAEEETARLSGVFEKMFRSMCNARPNFLAREQDPSQLPGIYEFPREFRKLRQSMVRFLVELCKPSQLNVGPFLRGFYFSGVRPVIVNELAPTSSAPSESQMAAGMSGATGMFRARAAAAPQAAQQRIVGQKKIPQWLFLGHFFNDVLLEDKAAKGASVASTKTSMARRILLGSACGLCLLYSLLLVISFAKNQALEGKVKEAARGIASVESTPNTLASLDSLRRLDVLRQSLEVLTDYDRNGAPLSYRWGLYVGDDLYPQTRRLYFEDFRQLLLGQTQDVLLQSLRSLPATPGPEYAPTYESLKAYLITTSFHDKSTRSFLSPVLLNRWSANRNVDADRMQLAQKQFDFYSDELRVENPYTNDNDAAAIQKARQYLSQFAGFERVYQAMLADASKNNLPINFNKRFPGSAETVIDNQEVGGPFTKGGWDFMKASLKNPERYFSGEQWVLGDQGAANIDRSKLTQQLTDRYHADFIKEWRAYLKAASVVKFASVPDASKKLNTLSGNQSPLLALFWLASQNTAVDAPDVVAAFQPVQAVVPPSSVDRYIAPPNQSYMNALVALQTSLEAIASQTPVSDAAAAQTLTNATQARVTTRQLAQVFRIDPEAHVETTVQKLMEDPITYVESMLRSIGPAELNAKGKVLCGQWHGVLAKYPFNPSATAEATVAEVNGVFHKPDGALWAFYDANLQKLLPKQGNTYVAAPAGNLTLNPAFVNFFNQASAFADSLYAGGTPDPHFTYTLKPVLTEGIQTLGLQIDGQSLSYSGGTAPPKQFTWQGSGTHEAKATVKFGGPELAWSTSEGLWAVFHFIGKADHREPTATGETLEWTIRIGKEPVTLPSGKPLVVRFELDMAGAPPVFQKSFASRLGCVAEVAKP